jgi:hypothetical protein
MFYADPSLEEERIQRIQEKYAILKKTQPLHFQKKDLFQVYKCWNDNFVSYTFNPLQNSVDSEWVSLEPKDRERHEGEGNWSLKNNLSDTEHEIFGCKMNVIEGNRFILQMNLKQMKDRSSELVVDENDNALILGLVNNKLCKLLYAFAQMKNSLLPEVDYLHLYGTSLANGELCKEKIYENNSS